MPIFTFNKKAGKEYGHILLTHIVHDIHEVYGVLLKNCFLWEKVNKWPHALGFWTCLTHNSKPIY